MWLKSALVYILIFVPLVVLGMDKILASLENDVYEESVECVAALVQKYFLAHQALSGFILSIKFSSSSVDMLENVLKTLHNYSGYPCTIVLLDTSFFEDPRNDTIELEEKPMAYLMINDYTDDFRDIVSLWKITRNWNANAQFILLLINEGNDEYELNEIFLDIISHNMRSKKIYNVFAISPVLDEGLVFGWTFFPYHPDNDCGRLIQKTEKIDICQDIALNREIKNREEENSEELYFSRYMEIELNKTTIGTIKEIQSATFSDKYSHNLNGCPLTVAYRPWEPYIFEQNTQKCSSEMPIITKGLEYKLLQTIGDVLNLNIVLKKKEPHLFLLYQTLIDGEVELILGGIDENPKLSMYVSSAITYYQDDLTFCVAKGKLLTEFGTTTSTMQTLPNILLICFRIVMSLGLFLSQKLLNVRVPQLRTFKVVYLRIWGVTYGQNLPIKRIPAPMQFLLVCSFFMGLLVSNVFQSVLIYRLTADKGVDQVSRVQDIFDREMFVTGQVQSLYFLDKDNEAFKYIRRGFKMCENIEICLQQAAKDETLAVSVPRQHVLYNPRIPRRQLYCFNREENMYTYLITMMMSKDFHLIYKINPVISSLIESGLLGKWASDIEEVNRHQQTDAQVRRPLSITDMWDLWALAGLWQTVAFNLFILEVMTYYLVVRMRSRNKFFNWLHKMFIE